MLVTSAGHRRGGGAGVTRRMEAIGSTDRIRRTLAHCPINTGQVARVHPWAGMLALQGHVTWCEPHTAR